MSELEALLTGIVNEPTEETRWLVLADWLEENDDRRRGELLRLHRKLLATCCDPKGHKKQRKAWQTRIVELISEGVEPCVPQQTISLPGGIPMTLTFIPPGSFLMGGNDSDSEKPVHKVTLTKGFFVGVHLVSQKQWEAVMKTDPSHFKGPNRPVEQVSWANCHQFCKKITKSLKGRGTVRLLTESEWEYACRSGTTTEYHFGDVINTDLVNYNGRDSWSDRTPKGKDRKETTDVGSFPANPWGLYDVHGNVWEWCEDWADDYPTGEVVDPLGPETGKYRVMRGGSFGFSASGVRSASRNYIEPENCSDFLVSFRLAGTL